jgi:hypothetical protein
MCHAGERAGEGKKDFRPVWPAEVPREVIRDPSMVT